MVWQPVVVMEEEEHHHQNPSFDALHDSKRGHAVARSGGARGRIASLNRSFSLKLLGIFLVAQQFTAVSAKGVCHAFSSITKKFDLIGLVSTFGTAAATKSLSYSALNDNWFYLTGHVGPGSLSVASVLFEAAGSSLAHLLSLGGAQDAYQLVQLDCPDGLRYIGLKSNTECPVGNSMGASIVQEHQSLWTGEQSDEPMVSTWLGQEFLDSEGRDENREVKVEVGPKFGRRVGRDARREVKVIVLEVGKTNKKMRVLLKACKGGTLLLGWLPLLLTVGAMASSCSCNEWFVAGLIALGTLGMTVGVLGLRLCPFKYSMPDVAKGAPAGDCLVVDVTNADTLHIIMGEEKSIQALFQRKIDYEASRGKYALLLAGSILYVYVVASVLYMPNVSVSGQILFAIANLIGLVTDIVKASKNGKLGMAKKACEQFKIVKRDLVVFRNRTAAVAFVAKHAKDRTMLKSTKLLPCEGPVWQKWWEELAKCDGEVDDTCTTSADVVADDADKELLKTLLRDMMDGLKA